MLLHLLKYAIIIIIWQPISIGYAKQVIVDEQNRKQCGTQRFIGPYDALKYIPENLPAIKHEIKAKFREIENLERELNHHDWNVSISQNVETKNFADDQYRRTPGALTALNISYPLNIAKLEHRRRLLKKKLELSKIRLASLQRENISRKLSLLVDLKEAQNLERILNLRLSIKRQLKSYYSTLRENGQPEFEKELQLASEILVLNDQILGNSVNMASTLLQLGLSNEPELPGFFEPFKILPFNDGCGFETFELLILKTQIEIAEIELQDLERTFDYAIDFSLNLQTNRVDNQNVTEAASASVNLIVPISDGGRRNTQKIGKIKELNDLKTKFFDLNATFNQENLSYASKEQLFLASLKSIKNDITGVQKRLSELDERERLGQTVFVEKSNLKIEEAALAESLLRLAADLYQEWYKFQIDKKFVENE